MDCGKTKPRTEMRETRQQVRLRHPVTLLLVRCVGREVSAGGLFAAGRDGARRRVESIETRAPRNARASIRARRACVSMSKASKEKSSRRRLPRAFGVSRAKGQERRAERGRARGRRRGRPLLRYPYQVPDPKRSDVPLSGGGPVCGHPPPRLTRARRKRRRVARSRRASPMASAWARTEKASVRLRRRRLDRDRSRPPARAEMRRPRAPSCAGRASSGPRTERRSASATKATPRVSKAPRPGGDV